jgi:hypothetical protein
MSLRQPPGRFLSPWRAAAGALLILSIPVVWAVAGCRTTSRHASLPATPAAPAAAADAVPQHLPVVPSDLRRYAGSKACAPCHPREAGQQETHHARTLARVDTSRYAGRFRRSGTLRDPFLKIDYATEVRSGKCLLVATDGRHTATVAADFAFGSGNRGTTFLGQFHGRTVELRLSYYRPRNGWDFSPSQQVGTRTATPLGRALSPQVEGTCFNCHSTALVEEGGHAQPGRSILGIGCEACHGPGREHIEAARRGAANLRMADLSRQRAKVSDQLCGQCHRPSGPDDPGDPNIQPQLARFQQLALSLSACFTKSGSRLSCITCHDPHRDADRTSHAEYNQQCRGCHSRIALGEATCKFRPQGDCVACHMPAQTLAMPTQPRYRNHWIKVWPAVDR